MIDTHSHILPGIDDGARNIAESVDMVRQLANQGVTDIIATPHYIDGTSFVSPRVTNLQLLTELQQALVEKGIKVNLYLGNEIYISDNILELLRAGKISPLADSKYLLIELPLDGEFSNYEDHLQSILKHGYKVVLAHPERYDIIQKDYEIVLRLHEMGILFQCNVGSIVDRYGKEAKRVIKRMAKDKMIFMLGSDIHRCSRSDYVVSAQRELAKCCNERELGFLMVRNPQKIIGGLGHTGCFWYNV